jgi:hypothetical protein
MQLVLAAKADPALAMPSDGFADLIGKRALQRRRRSLEKDRVEEQVEDKATDTGSRHGTATTKGKEESGKTVQEGDTPTAPPNRGPARGWRCQKWAI